jgi:hypothetical protein
MTNSPARSFSGLEVGGRDNSDLETEPRNRGTRHHHLRFLEIEAVVESHACFSALRLWNVTDISPAEVIVRLLPLCLALQRSLNPPVAVFGMPGDTPLQDVPVTVVE